MSAKQKTDKRDRKNPPTMRRNLFTKIDPDIKELAKKLAADSCMTLEDWSAAAIEDAVKQGVTFKWVRVPGGAKKTDE